MLLHKLPLDKRIRLYRDAFALHREGLGIRKIERRFRSTYGYSVAAANISKWIYHGARPDSRAHNPNLSPSPQLSYFIGAYKGDGFEYCNTKRRIFRVGFRVKDKDFARHASSAVGFVLRRNPIPLWTAKGYGGPNDVFHVFTADSWILRSFLRQRLESLLAVAMKFPREFLRGIFDAEGFVSISRCRNRMQIHVGIGMSSPRIIKVVRRVLLAEFGIASTGPYRTKAKARMMQGHLARFKRTTYAIRISALAELEKFARLVGFSIRRKNRRLEDALKLRRATDARTALIIWDRRKSRRVPHAL